LVIGDSDHYFGLLATATFLPDGKIMVAVPN